jgi:chemotaxis protein CheX
MATALADAELAAAAANPLAIVEADLAKAVISSVQSGLAMCETGSRCVGLSAVPSSESGLVTGLIGVHGRVSGFITVNLSQRFAIRAVEGLLQEKFGTLTSQVVDGVGEITNIIVGGIKS